MAMRSASSVDIERGPDLATGPLEQVEPGTGLHPVGDVKQEAHRPEHLAVVRHPVRRPGQDPALAGQGLLYMHVDHGNAPVDHPLGEGALGQGRVRANLTF
jgi:hypothetical protein